MNKRGEMLTGLIIAVFLVLVLSPILYNFAVGNARSVPDLKPPPGGQKQCIESKEWMRGNHMQLLFDWRETVVREGNRTYRASDGKEYNMSLTSECLSCHTNKDEFCDQCHDYLKVKPYCWDCHIVPPKENA
jgi:hypothetical protein